MNTESTLARRTMVEPEVIPEKKFARAVLPWLIAAGALALYLVTLNRWVSFNSLVPVAKVSGWIWQPEIYAPLYWLVTYPFRWLPPRAIPLGLNLFSAVCAVLTLALLARSVALLPHDRTHDQRERERGPFGLLSSRSAWLPPVLAALVCGLQLTFWEYATAASGGSFPLASSETFDLLLFAYVIRCILEFRIDQREAWLTRAAFIYGLAMTNNWAMIGFFPLFLTALVWTRGLSFFNARFLVRMALWGLAGLSLYLVLPLVQSRAELMPVPFWAALKANLGGQEYTLAKLFNIFRYAKQVALLLGLTSLLPIVVIAIHWPSYFGDTSKLGVALTTIIFHVVHGLLLVACIWVALDPPVSPRFMGVGPCLTLAYLGALSVGYFSGYFLLLFGGKPVPSWPRTPALLRLVNLVVTSLVWLLLLITPATLIYRNLPQIRTTNGPLLKQYTALLAQDLPSAGAIVLSDPDAGANIPPRRMLLMESAATQSGHSKDYMFLDTGALKWPDYHRFLKKKYAGRWPSDPPKERQQAFDPAPLREIIAYLARSNSVYYLHPSFGYYFEFMYPEPHGLVCRLKSYPTNTLITPLLSEGVIAENEAFWAKADGEVLKPLLTALAPPQPPGADPTLMEQFMTVVHLKPTPNRDASVLAAFYSRALDYWGVELQRNNRLPEAAAHFERARELNSDNLVAKVNLECNQNLRAGRKSFVQLSKSAEDEFGRYAGWDDVMGENGPFDEPRFCYQQARVYAHNGLYRQAAHQFDRVKTLTPDNLAAHLWLAQLYVLTQMPDQALKAIEEIHTHPERLPIPRTNQTELLVVETSAHLALNDLQGAEAVVQSTMAKYPGDQDLLATATQVYMNYACYSNALVLLERQLLRAPDNSSTLVNKGYACIQLGDYARAIAPLTQVLAMETNNFSETHYTALLNRAIAYLRSDQIEAAQRDYEELQKAFPTAFRVYYGLEEIAYRKKDTNACIRNCELYLANSRTNTEEAKLVIERLKELKPGPSGKARESEKPRE